MITCFLSYIFILLFKCYCHNIWSIFNCNYLNNLLENISKEQKLIFLLGDFNVNLLNYDEHNQTNEFLDSLASNSFLPLILQPTRITSHSNTLIDNIFSNVIDPSSYQVI